MNASARVRCWRPARRHAVGLRVVSSPTRNSPQSVVGLTITQVVLTGIVALTAIAMEASPVSGQAPAAIAWGASANGLRVGIDRPHDAPTGSCSLALWFENTGTEDYLLNLGLMLSNARRMDASAVSLVVGDGGAKTLHPWRGPLSVGGRVDDYLVALRAGSRYMIAAELINFRGASALEPALAPRPGRYQIAMRFVAQPPRATNGDTLGIGTWHFWTGSVDSRSIDMLMAAEGQANQQLQPSAARVVRCRRG